SQTQTHRLTDTQTHTHTHTHTHRVLSPIGYYSGGSGALIDLQQCGQGQRVNTCKEKTRFGERLSIARSRPSLRGVPSLHAERRGRGEGLLIGRVDEII